MESVEQQNIEAALVCLERLNEFLNKWVGEVPDPVQLDVDCIRFILKRLKEGGLSN